MFRRLGASIRKWMYGRYGSDQLNMLLLVLAVILSLTNTILTYALRTSTVYRGIIAPAMAMSSASSSLSCSSASSATCSSARIRKRST